MLNDMNSTELFCNYYKQWIDVYKKDAIRDATLAKYRMTHKWVERLVPELKVSDLTRTVYQKLLNDYAKEHERQTTLDFHHQLKGAILDAVDEGLIERDPTRKAIIKGKMPKPKKIKYLNQFELHTLISHLNIKEAPNWDWFILLVAKTGMRFSEALAVTPADFDFEKRTVTINKSYQRLNGQDLITTPKTEKSNRVITMPQFLAEEIQDYLKMLYGIGADDRMFTVTKSYLHREMDRGSKEAGVPRIRIHDIRHSAVSLLIDMGFSATAIADRVGHESIDITYNYAHLFPSKQTEMADKLDFERMGA